MNIIICDDGKKDRTLLIDLLKDYEQKNDLEFEITEYSSGIKLCEDHKALQKCQIVFLDINMDDMDGLKAAMKIKEMYHAIYIVLVTAYMNYVLDGYKVKASRFLLKDDLEQTIGECMDDLICEIGKNNQVVEFPFVEGKRKLRVDKIIYIETAKHKNLFYTQTQVYSVYQKLDEIERKLQGMGFVRIHLSFLVNLRYVERISSYVMKLKNGKELSVPKSRYAEVKRQFALFKGDE